ncbi:hypothetical protein [Sulfurimonas sp.]|uniref:hypothetical protein n=1 Tax=Sulfurimonas sp. TaxID=2022749 RepID=UPI00286EB260|nr:hypothetical protein [Sulfurimonas sp.]
MATIYSLQVHIESAGTEYTGHGIDNYDKDTYLGESAYSSKEVALSQEQFDTLQKFGAGI